MTRRASALALLVALLLAAVAPTTVAADTPPPLPASMAAAGDSITEAASTGGTLGADAPQNSWSTGTNSTVNSHFLRLQALNSNIVGQSDPTAVSGAKMVDLAGQMQSLASVQPDYLTVLIGGNDLCTNTVGEMTSVDTFRGQFRTAMRTLLGWPAENGAPEIIGVSEDTMVYVVSIPDVYQLWKLFKSSFFARLVWSSANICQSLLANPTSTQTADEQRRLEVRARNMAYNDVLIEVCAEFPTRCRHDNEAVFNTQLQRSDVSGDYFHPSISGQARLAAVSWDQGYWAAGGPPTDPLPPTAGFTWSCSDLTCSFTDASTDTDGTIAGWAWDFGDGGSSTAQNPTHKFSTYGDRTVTLTVTDSQGLTGSVSKVVSVTKPPANVAPTASFTFACTGLACSFDGSASSDSDGTIASYAWNFGDGATATGATASHTYGTTGTYPVTLTVTDDDGAPATSSQDVAVSSPTLATIHVADLEGSGETVNRNFWRATVTVTVVDSTGTPVSGATVTGSFSGSAKSCTTDAGACTVTSDNLRQNVDSVTYSVTNVTHGTLGYNQSANVESSIAIARPS